MKQLKGLIEKARHSAFWNWILNQGLLRGIPFNHPHRLWVNKLTESDIEISIPYRKSNLNHLKGLHACVLATASEYATGLLLIQRLDPEKYRIIMQRMEMQYLYQGKQDSVAKFSISEEWLQTEVLKPLETSESIIISADVNTYDRSGNQLTAGKVFWQVKNWKSVRTKL